MQKSFIAKQASPDRMVDLVEVGYVMVLLGLGVVAAAILQTKRRGSEVKGAGVVLIGPIPIAFGSDAKWVSLAIVLAIILMVIVLLQYLV